MSKKLETFGSSKYGKLHIIKSDMFWKSFNSIFKDGDRLRITIEKIYSKRSNQQNRYYYGVVIPILLTEINEQGNNETKKTLHEELLKRFAPKVQIINKNGEYFERPMRSHEMNKAQMSDYTFDVIKWASEFWSVSIPEPGEQTKLFTN